MSRDTNLYVQLDDKGIRCVNRLLDDDFTLLRADVWFPPDQQYEYYGRCVAYDERIINDMASRVSNSRPTILDQRSEGQSQGMNQLPAD